MCLLVGSLVEEYVISLFFFLESMRSEQSVALQLLVEYHTHQMCPVMTVWLLVSLAEECVILEFCSYMIMLIGKKSRRKRRVVLGLVVS